MHDNWSVFSLTPAERHTEAHLASLPFCSYHFNTNCDHLGCSVRAMGTGMKAHENVHSIPGLCPPRGCPDYRCQVLCLQQSQQVMHKFTDSSNGTSFSNKKWKHSILSPVAMSGSKKGRWSADICGKGTATALLRYRPSASMLFLPGPWQGDCDSDALVRLWVCRMTYTTKALPKIVSSFKSSSLGCYTQAFLLPERQVLYLKQDIRIHLMMHITSDQLHCVRRAVTVLNQCTFPCLPFIKYFTYVY